MPNITIGNITLDFVTKYRVEKTMGVAIKNISNIADSGQLIDADTYFFERPLYQIRAKISNKVMQQIQEIYESQIDITLNDGITSDTVTVSNFRYKYQVGYNLHLIDIELMGSTI